MMSTFFIPQENMMGKGSFNEAIESIKGLGYKKMLVVTDKVLVEIGLVKKVTDQLNAEGIETVIYDGTKPNPTVTNVEEGVAMFQANGCDSVMTLGGGSPHDCGKGIALVTKNGGKIEDYEGLNQSKSPQTPLIAVNTTAGTASEMTRFCIITDEIRHIKMAIVDKNVTPLLSVNDSILMMGQPASLTAATGMDALTHAIEAYVSTAATPMTDALALEAIRLIQANLRTAVEHGDNEEAREAMAYAQFMAGCAFNNASLGYVHAMAHQLGGLLDLPHGICNAVLLPHVQAYNSEVAGERLAVIAQAMGVDTTGMSTEEATKEAINAINSLSKDVGTLKTLTELGVKEEHIVQLATNALKDVCGLTNPKQATNEEICQIFRNAM
ncbi:MAG: L-threonine dehydrogenase [Chloroflexi bacterium]|nr:L-threonine dehydrogenase [Chloroflexota bacterium]